MGYVIAAYVLAIGGTLAYGIFLSRERRALERALSRGEDSNPG